MGPSRYEVVATLGALTLLLGGTACDRQRSQEGGIDVNSSTHALSVNPGPTMSTPRKDFAVVELDSDHLMVIGGSNGVVPLSSCEVYTWSTGVWTLTRPMAVSRILSQAVLYNYSGYNKILVVGGDSPAGAAGAAELYDVSSNAWTALTTSPVFHQDFRAWNAGNNKIVLAGGRDASGNYLQTVDVFDMSTQTLSTGIPLPGPRAGYGLVTIGGNTYACGGRTSATGFLSDCVRYDSSSTPSTGWHRDYAMNTARADFFAYQDMVFGGRNATGALKSVEMGSPTGFLALADMYASRVNAEGDSSSSTVVWLTGGTGDSGAIRASTETVRRPVGGSAFFTPAMAVARTGHGAWMHDVANGIVFGGQDGSGNTLATTEKFNFGVGQWKLTGKPVVARAGHVAAPLGSGDVLLAGGYQSGSSGNVALVFSPSTKNWVSSTTASSYYSNNLQIGDGQSAVKLPGNQGVLVTGSGYCSSGGYCYDSYAYSAIFYAGGWQTLTQMQAFHRHPATVLLGTGTVLVAGGGQWDAPSDSCPESCYGSATVETYRTGLWSKAQGMIGRCGNAAAALASPYQDQGIVCGGRPYSSSGSCTSPADPQRSCQKWNDTTKLGASIAPMLYPRADFALVALSNGKIIAIGGGPTTTEIYDPATDAWTAGAAMQASQTRFGHAWLDATHLLVVNRGVGAEIFTYNPATGSGSWSAAASPACSETQSNASVEIHLAALGGGQALAVGGNSCPPEIYSLATNAWQQLPCLAGSDGFVPTPLDDGTVLLTGGYTLTGRTALASAEVYSLTSGTFKAAASSMAESRMFAAGATLNDGSALVLGGTDGWTVRSSTTSYANGTWGPIPALNDCRASAVGTCADRIKIAVLPGTGDIVVAGGCNFDSAVTTMEVYSAGRWSYLAAPPSLYSVQNLHALANGRMLAVGDTKTARQMSLLGAASPHTWSSTPAAPYDFEQVNSALLPDGTIFVTGSAVYQTDASALAPVASLFRTSTGDWASKVFAAQPPDLSLDFFGLRSGSVFRMKNDAYAGTLYSFPKDTWLTTNSTNTSGSDGTLTLLANGKVLLVRGPGSAELYTEDSATSGQLCDTAADCPGTAPNCVDHLCCDSPCANPCSSCAQPGFEGRCTQMPMGSACRGIACYTCDTGGVCSVPTPSVPCDDGDPQTFNDTCSSGQAPVCTGTQTTCRATSQCEAAVSFDGANNCVFIAKPVGTPCDDGNNCTENEACNGSIGADVSPNRICVGGTMKTCAASTDPCWNVTADCTANVFTCKKTFRPGVSCDDGQACTQSDTCDSATQTCKGTLRTCAAPSACTNATASCAADGTLVCTPVNVPAGSKTCDDLNPCSYGDTCDGNGNCAGNTYQCTLGECDSSVTCNGTGGCTRSYKSWGTSCDDGNSCTTGEYCNGSGACVGGTLKTCPVSTDPCMSWVGQCTNGVLNCTQVFHPGTSCNDGNACTFGDTCDAAGACKGTDYQCNASSCQQSSVCDGTGKCTVQNRPQGATCDDGVACTQNDACDGKGTCAGTPYVCPLGECDQGVTCNGSGGCNPVFKRAGTLCRESTGDCDVAETCTGASSACPADGLKTGNVCRPSAGPCDVAETCTGSSKACPADTFVAASSVCRNSTGPCNLAETCTGYSAACPSDAVQAAGTQCRAANGICDKAEVCDGASKACPMDTYQPPGTACRASAGACDLAESCTGASPTCPNDTKVASGTVCRPATGDCDVAESCDGQSAACPNDVPKPRGTVCRASAGDCDVDEVCDGSSKVCPPTDAKKPAGTVCRASGGDCDVEEKCDGVTPACPNDWLKQAGTVCRTSAGDCDDAEYCTGASKVCPPDALKASGAVCRPATGDCDVAETCTGSSVACPADVFAPRTTLCRAQAGECDVAETCTGLSRDCPANQVLPVGTECRPASDKCDLAESCDGLGPDCPKDVPSPAGTECRAASGICDRAEVCTGLSKQCPADEFKPASILCRSAAGPCDQPENCTGLGPDCPADATYAIDHVCRPAAGPCDTQELCSGKDVTCPPDGKLGSGAICRRSVGDCDRSEYCDGTHDECPADLVVASGTVCRPADGECDTPETCNGRDPILSGRPLRDERHHLPPNPRRVRPSRGMHRPVPHLPRRCQEGGHGVPADERSLRPGRGVRWGR